MGFGPGLAASGKRPDLDHTPAGICIRARIPTEPGVQLNIMHATPTLHIISMIPQLGLATKTCHRIAFGSGGCFAFGGGWRSDGYGSFFNASMEVCRP